MDTRLEVERVPRTLEAMDRLRQRGRLLLGLAALTGFTLGWSTGGLLYGLIGAVTGAVLVALPVWVVRGSLRRRLDELRALSPAEAAKAEERYLIARSVSRASRWKLFR